MDRVVLMVAFHFPPAAMGSGHLRTLGFARHLPDSGWNPIVLSARKSAYPRTVTLQKGIIPEGCRVHRTLALDASRHLAVAGKYPGFLAQPDRWATWWLTGVVQGLRLIRKHKVRAIWSTYPIMSAHCIARTLSDITKLPWIADFRDPVSSSVEAENPFSVASQKRWERRVLDCADRTVFTTPGALRACADCYPEADRAGRLSVIGNGYDEMMFAGLPEATPRTPGEPLVLLHSGALYPDGRDPFPFFAALARLKGSGRFAPRQIKVVLRASSCEARYRLEIERLGIADIVTLAPPVGNRDALLEQASADGLLLFQGDRFNRQIPAKVYEYLRIGRPIFALAAADGDTAALLREVNAAMVPLDDVLAIEHGLARFIQSLVEEHGHVGPERDVKKWSRRQGAIDLAGLLDTVTARVC